MGGEPLGVRFPLASPFWCLPLPPETSAPWPCIALAKLNASLAESYILLGVGVLRGELACGDAWAKNGKPLGEAVPDRGMYDGRLLTGASSIGVMLGDWKKQNLSSYPKVSYTPIT